MYDGGIGLDASDDVNFNICGREFGPGKVDRAEEVECKKGDQISIG